MKKSAVRTLPDSLHALPVAAVKCSISPLPEDYLNFTELFSTVTADREVRVLVIGVSKISVLYCLVFPQAQQLFVVPLGARF